MAALDVLAVPVQGADAAAQIAGMLARAARSGRYDVLLVTRGGGSLEDLWAFNDERLARAIHASAVPVVSAVGHEVDFTIADFVADVRAPTPSAAAELLVPSAEELCREIGRRRQRAAAALRRGLAERAQRLDRLWARLAVQHPAARLAGLDGRLTRLAEGLRRSVATTLAARRRRAELAGHRHAAQHPAARVAQRRQAVALLYGRLTGRVALELEQARRHCVALARALNAVGPLATLERGYAIVFDRDSGAVVRSVHQPTGERFEARLADGSLWLRRD
jgi:exodeoxyribonuclease VII large subunit